MKTPRMCQRFYCDWRGDRYCCADCWNLKDCVNPCLNHPSRCRLEDTGARFRMEELHKVNRTRKTGIKYQEETPDEDYD